MCGWADHFIKRICWDSFFEQDGWVETDDLIMSGGRDGSFDHEGCVGQYI